MILTQLITLIVQINPDIFLTLMVLILRSTGIN